MAIAVELTAGVADAEPNPSVDVFVASTPETLTLVERALGIGEHRVRWLAVDRIDEAQVLRRPHEHGSDPARVWIDCTSPERVRFYFANWQTGRFLARDVPLPNGWDELARESLAQVMDSSITALATDAMAGISQTEMASVLRTSPVAPSASAPPWRIAWGAFYAAQAFAPEQPIEHGPGLVAAFGPRSGRWRPGAWISTQYQLPESIGTGLIGVRLDTIAIRAGVKLTRGLTDRVAIAVQLGAGGDVVHITPRQGSAARASLSPDRFSWEYSTDLALSAMVRVNGSVELWAAMLADADLGMRHYDVVVDGSTVRAFTPWWLRPGLLVGVTWP